ncbi:TIGR04388 family protein, partial [Leptospira bourretii]
MQVQLRKEERVVRVREYGAFTRIQATLGILSVFCMLLSTPHTLSSQELIPDLQTAEYDHQFMNQFYGQVYFQNNLTSWTNYVQNYVGTARAAWEASVDTAINSYVDNITTSDNFNSVDAYKDYVLKEMQSQKSQALLNWEDEANRHFLENQSEFVSKLNTNYVDSSYLSRIGQQSLYNQYLNNLAVTQNLQNQVAVAATSWQNTYNQNYQQGLNDFASSITNITEQYESIKNSIAQNHSIFQQNLDVINQYKTTVVNSIKGMLDSFQTDLDTGVSCNLDGGCTYHEKGGALNTAGELLKDFLSQMRPKVESAALDPSLFFSEISSSFSTFLQSQKDLANSKYEFHESNILTYQNSTGINYDTYRNYSQAQIDALRNAIIYQQYGAGSAIFSNDQWGYAGGGGALYNVDFHRANFSTISDANHRDIYESIYLSLWGGDLNFGVTKDTLQRILGSNYEVTRVLEANIYSDWQNGANTDGLAWLYLKKIQGNFRIDGNAFAFWTAVRAIPPYVAWDHHFQMSSLQAGLLYEVKDKNQEALATHWNGTTSSLGNQLSLFTDKISPAISNWETQVKSYNDFYTAWQAEASQLEADAEAQYEQSLANLEREKTAWLAAMEKERNDGISQWTNLYQQAGQMQNQSDYVNFVNNANATVNGVGTGNVATNTSSIVSKFDNAIDQLAQRKFDTEPPATPTFTSSALDEGKLYAGGSSGGFSGVGGAVKSIQENFLKGTTDYIENKIGSAFGVGSFSPVSGSSGGYSILGAASEKKVDTSLSVNGKDVFNYFQETTNGVYQYSQILSANENNENAQRIEQQKLINQYAYVVNWDNRAEGALSAINQYYLDQMNAFQCNRGCTDYQGAFDARFQAEIAQLKNQGLEYLNGKIVKSLTLEEKILVGQADYKTLTDDQKKDFGKCFANPTQGSCGQLLVQEFDYSINEVSNVATLTKRISDGSIAGRDANGYYSGKKDEVRHISLSNLEMVSAPKDKGLFDVWEEADWQSFADASSNALNDFYTNLSKDSTAIGNATTSIRKTEAANEKAFQQRKTNQEKNDSLIQELALAYFTGGAAGVQASIRGKIEDHINTELAKAWISATGGSEEDIQMASMLIDFMKGRVEARRIESRSNFVSISNPIQAVENMVRNSLSTQINFMNNATNGVFGSVLNIALLPYTLLAQGVMGKEAFNDKMDQAHTRENRMAEIKANEFELGKAGVSQAVAGATGLPVDLISTAIADYHGERQAARVRETFQRDPFAFIGANVIGAIGGLVKTVVVATGVTESEFQSALNANHAIVNSGNYDPASYTQASLVFSYQYYGMKSSEAHYNTSVIDVSDTRAVVDELGKQAIANHIATSMGIDPSVAKGFVDKGYADHQQRINDRKAQAAAIEQVAVTAATTAITMGAGAALSAMVSSTNAAISAMGTAIANFGNAVGSAVGSFFGATASGTSVMVTNAMGAAVNVGSTAVNTVSAFANALVQGTYGSRNGIEGALAGVANGLIGGLMKGDALSGIKDAYFGGMTPGLGITYSPDNGWGGMIGLGNTIQNASISFSQHGDTTVQGSYSLGGGVQLAGDVTTNGAANIGLNYNPTGEGPRRDWNFSLMYDMAGTGLSASAGYTHPGSTLGLTSTINRDGLSTSAELTGVSIATNGPNGFQMDELNFAEQNINAAQDKTQDDQNPKVLGSDDSPPNDNDFFDDMANAGTALAGLLAGGTAVVTGLFGGSPTPAAGRPATPTPSTSETVV